MASGYMVINDHSDSERGNPLPPHGLLFSINSNRISHTMAFVTPVVEHWLEREIAQWVHPMKDRSDNSSHHERTLLPRRYISLPNARGDLLLPLHEPLFVIIIQESFICIIQETCPLIPLTLCYKSIEHSLKQEIIKWIHQKGSIRRPRAPQTDALSLPSNEYRRSMLVCNRIFRGKLS